MRQHNVRLWERDLLAKAELARSPMLARQVADLYGAPQKKIAERLTLLYRAGWLRRVPYFQPAMQGSAAFAYFDGRQPAARTLQHTILIAEVRVQLARGLRNQTSYTAEFFYAHEITLGIGVIPDATMLLHKADRTQLIYVEVDNGTESVRSTASYSLRAKLRAYAAALDANLHAADFSSYKLVRGFRVALIAPPGRARNLHGLVRDDAHDFALIATTNDLDDLCTRPVFKTHGNRQVDLLGRAGDQIGAPVGELVKPTSPTANDKNALAINRFAPAAQVRKYFLPDEADESNARKA